MTPLNISTQDIYTRHTEERPSLKTLAVKTDSSFNKEFPLVWHFPSCFFTCQTTVILNAASSKTTSGEHLPLCTSRSV